MLYLDGLGYLIYSHFCIHMAQLTEPQFKYLSSLGIKFHEDQAQLVAYGHDETEDFVFPPELVLIPSSAEEISKIMSYCHEHSIPLTPAGARTGLRG